jgi:phosphocarrier protein
MALIEREATIVNPLGVHARPAAEIVKTAGRFASAIEIRRGEVSVNGKSIMGVMMLAAEQGAVIIISANGDDAAAAVEALCALVAAGFNEMDLTE